MEQVTARNITSPIRDNKKKKVNLEYLRDKDRELVKGVFKYYEVPNGVLEFSFLGHKGDQVQKYTLYDGEYYSLPLGVAKHLNNDCWYPIHRHHMDETGKPTAVIGKKVRRTGFHSLEFADIEGLGSSAAPHVEIITVEKI